MACAKSPPLQERLPPDSEDVVFASSLDNARKFFLVLKCVYLPFSAVFTLLAAIYTAIWYFGYVANFSYVTYISVIAQAISISVPTFLAPRIIYLRWLPQSLRLAIVNSLFASMCLLIPIINAHKVWRRQYTELNGFLLAHELMPSAPPRARPAVVAPHQPLSICDDEIFLFLAANDHASMMWSNFMMWNFIELPRNYFALFFSVHFGHFWVSAHRLLNVYASACGSVNDSALSNIISTHWQPVLHMVQLTCYTTFLMTRLFVMSRNCEENKKWLTAVLQEAFSISKLHFQALLRVNQHQAPQRPGTFWSRTEFLFSSSKEPPLVLPAIVGSAFKTCVRLKNWGLFVLGTTLPILFIFFELMQQVIRVDPLVRTAFYFFFFKCALTVAFLSLPHTIFSKALLQRRVWSPWVVFLSCGILAVLGVVILMPGSLRPGGKLLFPVPRFFCCFSLLCIMPPTILRAFNRNTSAMFIVLFFLIIYA
jgi:hypothetical protein